jgi:hypothetical protein
VPRRFSARGAERRFRSRPQGDLNRRERFNVLSASKERAEWGADEGRVAATAWESVSTHGFRLTLLAHTIIVKLDVQKMERCRSSEPKRQRARFGGLACDSMAVSLSRYCRGNSTSARVLLAFGIKHLVWLLEKS